MKCFRGIDGVLGSCGPDGIRLWSLSSGDQLLHVRQPGANCLAFAPDGSHLAAGFADGSVRSYTPQTGRPIACAQGAHPCPGPKGGGATALAFLGRGGYTGLALVTAGADGQVRTWEVSPRTGRMALLTTVREHKRLVCSLQAAGDHKEFLSGSKDGFCIIWDATEYDEFTGALLGTT